ncbi:hypothetical protein D3C84_1306410 [compost metagenome]
MFHALEGEFEHADDRIHRRADFMTHGRQKRAFGSVGFIGTLLRPTQIIEQLPPLADVDPATNDALHFTA